MGARENFVAGCSPNTLPKSLSFSRKHKLIYVVKKKIEEDVFECGWLVGCLAI
jgi:hypothetical protein